jgi:hypothetical protein
MLSRHEEKYILTYAQYAILRQRAAQVLHPDSHGDHGTYTLTSLYFDDPEDTGLYEKLDGLPLHSKFRLRTYDCDGSFIKLERKDKKGILTHKLTATVSREQLPLLTQPGNLEAFQGDAQSLYAQLQQKACRPKVAVRYVRDAFYHPGSDLRLTFDRNLEALPPNETALFDPDFRGVPVTDGVIMEIKYGKYLPTFLRKLTRVNAPQLSLSKYALCRAQIGGISL